MPDDPSDLPGRNRGRVSLPENVRSPWWELGRRVLAALAILVGTVLLVYFDRKGYRDGNDPPSYDVNLVDSIYYTTVTLSTTGYGDIAPYKDGARLINAFIITPARIAFLVLLIGAAVNAAFDTVFPQKETTSARLELVTRLRTRMTTDRSSGAAPEDPAPVD